MAKAERQKAYKDGLWAETLAALYLILKGWRVVARRYKSPLGEIDLIARRGKTLLIIEVKTRAHMEAAVESVSLKAQGRIARAARHFISRHPQYGEYSVRFDVIAIVPPFRLRHLDNAWVEPS